MTAPAWTARCARRASDQPPVSYRIDHKAVRAFARELGLTGPLEIRRDRWRARSYGTHWFHCWPALGGGCDWRHVIVLEGCRDPEAVAGTLAHELRHALDAEAITREAGDEPGAWLKHTNANNARARAEGLPYRERDHERRANDFAAEHGAEVLARCFKVTAPKALDGSTAAVVGPAGELATGVAEGS